MDEEKLRNHLHIDIDYNVMQNELIKRKYTKKQAKIFIETIKKDPSKYVGIAGTKIFNEEDLKKIARRWE